MSKHWRRVLLAAMTIAVVLLAAAPALAGSTKWGWG